MRISTRESQLQAVRAMQDNQTRLARTQLQVSTGRAILTPADDPSGANRALELRRAAESQVQYQRNADAALNRLSLEEATLDSVTGVLQRVRELALQGANATLSRQDREAVAAEVRERLDELLGLANARDGQGEYLFSGSQSRTQPFVRSAGPGGTVYGYQGDDLVRAIQVSEGLQVPAGDSGEAVFVAVPNGNGTFATSEGSGNAGSGVVDAGSVVDPGLWTGHDYRITFVTNGAGQLAYHVVDTTGGAQVIPAPPADPLTDAPAFPAGGGTIAFAGVQVTIQGTPAAGDTFDVVPSTDQDLLTTVQHLVDALEGGATGVAGQAHLQNALGRAITDLDRGLENVLRVRAGVGARLNAVASQRQVAEGFELYARESLSGLEDLDYAEAVSRLQLELTVLEASQQAYVKVQGLSLFNYL